MSKHKRKKKNQETETYYIGKNISKTDNTRSPMIGVPNTNIDFYHKDTGLLARRRKLNKDGNAYVDLDEADIYHPRDHAHDIHNKQRTKDRNMTKKEEREFNKARKKRRFWKK